MIKTDNHLPLFLQLSFIAVLFILNSSHAHAAETIQSLSKKISTLQKENKQLHYRLQKLEAALRVSPQGVRINNLHIANNLDIGNNLNVGNNLSAGNRLLVQGSSDFSGIVRISGNLATQGNVNVARKITTADSISTPSLSVSNHISVGTGSGVMSLNRDGITGNNISINARGRATLTSGSYFNIRAGNSIGIISSGKITVKGTRGYSR